MSCSLKVVMRDTHKQVAHSLSSFVISAKRHVPNTLFSTFVRIYRLLSLISDWDNESLGSRLCGWWLAIRARSISNGIVWQHDVPIDERERERERVFDYIYMVFAMKSMKIEERPREPDRSLRRLFVSGMNLATKLTFRSATRPRNKYSLHLCWRKQYKQCRK